MTPSTWSQDEKLRALMRLPWTVGVERTDEGLVARVAEIPDAIATGNTERALAADLWQSLEASLACRLEFDDAIALPSGHELPWAHGKEPPKEAQKRTVVVPVPKELWTSLVTEGTASVATAQVVGA